MRRLLAALVMVLCLTSTSAAMVEETVEEHWLKRTVLVEERTSIWCPSCAEIDPELVIVANHIAQHSDCRIAWMMSLRMMQV